MHALTNAGVTHEAYNPSRRTLKSSELSCIIAKFPDSRVGLMSLSAAGEHVTQVPNGRTCIAVRLLEGRIMESIARRLFIGDIVWRATSASA